MLRLESIMYQFSIQSTFEESWKYSVQIECAVVNSTTDLPALFFLCTFSHWKIYLNSLFLGSNKSREFWNLDCCWHKSTCSFPYGDKSAFSYHKYVLFPSTYLAVYCTDVQWVLQETFWKSFMLRGLQQQTRLYMFIPVLLRPCLPGITWRHFRWLTRQF